MKKLLFLSFFLVVTLVQQALAQDRTITGKVTDRETNQGLPGVAVLVKGTTVGTATDIDGNFSLNVPENANTLQFKFIGYKTVERSIDNQATIDVVMGADAKQLEEVVVTALGLEREKKSLGYATQELQSETLTQGRDRSVLNSMQGKVAGVNISSSSGGPGSSTRVVIRGNKSFTGNNQALYVVDGIPIDNSSFGTGDNLNNGVDAGNRANDINPDDIESVNILKGPAATALYGSRAANGAIIITTKSGKGAAARGKKAEMTYVQSFLIEDVLRYPELQNRFGQGFFGDFDLLENTSWGPRFDGVVRPWGQIVNGQQKIKPYSALPDNIKEFYDYGHTWTNTLSLAGGNETSNYYASYSNTQQDGIVPTTQYDRNSVSFKGSAKLANKFTSTASMTYTKSNGDLAISGQGNSVFDQLIQTPRDIPVRELEDLNSPFNDVQGFYSPYTMNPYWAIKNQTFRNNVDRLFGNIQLGYDINDNFNILYRIGTDFYTDRRKQFRAIRTATGQNESKNDDGEYAEWQFFSREINSDLMANYKRNLSEDLTLNVLVGHNINQRDNDQLFAKANALASNQFQSLSNIVGNPTATSYRDVRRLHGLYSTVDLGFRDYLFLSLRGRNDWTSTLPDDNNSFFYPAVDVSFDAATAFDLSNTPISLAKLRANYAEVGNDAPVYYTRSVFVQGNISDGFRDTDLNFPFGGIAGFEVSNIIGNPNLKPERTKAWEIGTDLRFFNDRLNLDLSYYNSRSEDQILTVPVSYATGYGNAILNAGTISNKGIEVLLSGTPIQTNDFSWEVSVNYTKNKNRVEEVYSGIEQVSLGGLNSASLVIKEGEPYGLFQAEAILRDPQGRIVVNPATGTPRTAPEQAYVGSIQPDWTGGLVNTVKYKGIRFSIVFDTRQGGKFYSRTRGTQRFAGTAPETLFNDREPFVIPNSVVEVAPGEFAENTTPITNSNLYDYWGNLPEETNIIDASFTKLREVSLTYKLPTKWIENTFFGNVEVGVSGRNLVLWTPDENTYVDPEVNSFGNGNLQGYDFSGTPSTRSYGANIRVTF